MKRYFALLMLAVVGGLIGFKSSGQAEPPKTTIPQTGFPTHRYQLAASQPTATPASGPINLTGCQIKIFDEVQLAVEQAGVLDLVAVEGQMVQKGELLARTRDDLVKATLAVATRKAMNDVEIRFARKACELAQVEYERDLQANSIVPGTVSDLMLRAHRLAAEKALLQLEQAETALEIQKLERNETVELLNMHRVVAPMNGQVRTVFKKKGESVAEGEPILELVNPDRVKVEGYVHLRDLDSVRVGSLVKVQLDVPDVDLPSERLVFEGHIASVDVKVEPVTHRVKVWAEVKNDKGVLRDGLTARMMIDRHQVDHNFAASRQSPAE